MTTTTTDTDNKIEVSRETEPMLHDGDKRSKEPESAQPKSPREQHRSCEIGSEREVV